MTRPLSPSSSRAFPRLLRLAAAATAATMLAVVLPSAVPSPAQASPGDPDVGIGWYRPSDGSWHLTNSTSPGGPSDSVFAFGPSGDPTVHPVVGDWDGDLTVTAGWYRSSDASWHLNNSTNPPSTPNTTFVFGPAGDTSIVPVVGDWDGNGTETPGWYRPSDASWHLNNSNSASPTAADIVYVFGPANSPTVSPVVGDWDGDGVDTAGWYRPSDGSWHLSNAVIPSGTSNIVFTFGPAGNTSVTPIASDWNGDGADTAGWYRPSDASWHLTNTLNPSGTNITSVYGIAGNTSIVPLAGDWDGFTGTGTSAEEAAQAVLASGRLSGTTEVMGQLEGIANGAPVNNTVNGEVRTCFVDVDLLNFLREAVVERTYRLYLSSLNRYCVGRLTDSGSSSYHWREGGGHAVDVSVINGVSSTGGTTTAERDLIRLFGAVIEGSAGVGQVNCRSSISLPSNVVQFNDTCNHIHFESRS